MHFLQKLYDGNKVGKILFFNFLWNIIVLLKKKQMSEHKVLGRTFVRECKSFVRALKSLIFFHYHVFLGYRKIMLPTRSSHIIACFHYLHSHSCLK